MSIYTDGTVKITLPLRGVKLEWIDNRNRMVYQQEIDRKKLKEINGNSK